MPRYRVYINRTYHGSERGSIEVEAENAVDAEEKALNDIYNIDDWEDGGWYDSSEGVDEVEEIESDEEETELHPNSYAYLIKENKPFYYFNHPGYKDMDLADLVKRKDPSSKITTFRTFFDTDGSLKIGDLRNFYVLEPPEGQDFDYGISGLQVIRKDGVVYGYASKKVYRERGDGTLGDGTSPEEPDLSNIPTDLSEYLAQIEEAEG